MLNRTATLIDSLYNVTAEDGTPTIRRELLSIQAAAHEHRADRLEQEALRERAQDLGDALSDLFGYAELADDAWDLAADLDA